MVAGLEDTSSGTIKIRGEVVNDLEPKDRGIAMVFQNYALYPLRKPSIVRRKHLGLKRCLRANLRLFQVVSANASH